MLRLIICGGGNLATVCAGFIGAQKDVEVSVLTRRPEAWGSSVVVTDPSGRRFVGHLARVTQEAASVIPQTDIVLLCLPAFAVADVLGQIRPHLGPRTAVGSIVANTGFFFMAHRQLAASQPLFGFQRVPFIARTEEYGQRAQLLGYKPQLHVAIEHAEQPEHLRQTLERLFQTPTHQLGNFYEASLSNSNPILHTGRLFSLWHEWDGTPCARPILFYDEWTDEASALVLHMDEEFMGLTARLGITRTAIPPLLDYYESTNATTLTRKIRSIGAFHGLPAPMKQTDAGWVPDFQSRYFTEDFPFGLRFIHDLLHRENMHAPFIDEVYQWGVSLR